METLDDLYSGRFLKASNLHQWPLACHITSAEIVTYDDGKRQIGLTFAEFPEKVLGLNKTNMERIRYQFGDNWQRDWLGQTVTLVIENVDFQGKITPAIRIAMPAAQPGQQTPADQWRAQQAPQSIQQGVAQAQQSTQLPPNVVRDSDFDPDQDIPY